MNRQCKLIAMMAGLAAVAGLVVCVPGVRRSCQFLTTDEAARKASVALHPLGRLGRPADIASAICWLLSAEQSWVTGQVLHVDGGLSTVQAR